MITVYTQPNCSQCHVLKYFLEKKNIAFIECQDLELMANVKKFTNTPQLELEDGTILNYNQALTWIKNQENNLFI